jgi:hypothetical protein
MLNLIPSSSHHLLVSAIDSIHVFWKGENMCY